MRHCCQGCSDPFLSGEFFLATGDNGTALAFRAGVFGRHAVLFSHFGKPLAGVQKAAHREKACTYEVCSQLHTAKNGANSCGF